MILEDETFEAFGYYPSSLKPQSGRPIIAACEICGEFRILPKYEYRTLCKSCSHIRERNYMFERNLVISHCLICGKEIRTSKGRVENGRGKYCSRGCKGKALSRLTKEDALHWCGGSVTCICLFCGKEFERDKGVKKHGRGKYCSRSCLALARMQKSPPAMTAPEKKFEEICIKYKLPFVCNVSAKQHIGNAIPDFVHTSKKIVVEVFGDYWHSPLINRNVSEVQTVEGRTAQLKAEGYKTIILWESDLMREDAEEFVLHEMHKCNIYSNL